MNIPDDIYDLTIRYLSDEISPEEWQKLKSWIDLSDEHRKAIRDVEEVWFSAIEPDELKRFDKEAAYQNFIQQTRLSHRPAVIRRWIVKSVACAAAVALTDGHLVCQQGGSEKISGSDDGMLVRCHGNRQLPRPDPCLSVEGSATDDGLGCARRPLPCQLHLHLLCDEEVGEGVLIDSK